MYILCSFKLSTDIKVPRACMCGLFKRNRIMELCVSNYLKNLVCLQNWKYQHRNKTG